MTTVVLNLAALLAKLGKQVIAVELHPDFSTFSGQLRTVTPAHTLAETLAMEPALITETFVGSHLVATTFGPRILFGPQKLDEFGALDPTRIGVILGRLLPQADYIVVDLPAVTSPAHETVVKNSAIVVVVLEPEITSVSAASVRLQQLAAWGANDSAIKLLVVNRQGTMMLSRREIENRLSREIDGVAPPASESLNIAVQYGNPLVLYQPEHQTSINLADFVTRITKKPVSASK